MLIYKNGQGYKLRDYVCERGHKTRNVHFAPDGTTEYECEECILEDNSQPLHKQLNDGMEDI